MEQGDAVDKQEATAELTRVMAEYRNRSYDEWVHQIDGDPITLEILSSRGNNYQVEIEAIWDSGREGDIRVVFSIDDGGWSAFVPLTESFVITPDGTFK